MKRVLIGLSLMTILCGGLSLFSHSGSFINIDFPLNIILILGGIIGIIFTIIIALMECLVHLYDK